jgi:hypothetical protein
MGMCNRIRHFLTDSDLEILKSNYVIIFTLWIMVCMIAFHCLSAQSIQ